MISAALVLPSPRALLPPESVEDPVAELRSACVAVLRDALAAGPEMLWVVARPVRAANRRNGITDPLGHRVARSLLAAMDVETPPVRELVASTEAGEELRRSSGTLLVMADGSARRNEKAPGHLHPDAIGFDATIERALREGDPEELAALDPVRADELWCRGVPAFHVLAEVARDRNISALLAYAGAPYGVAWWVARWDLG